MNSSSTSWLFFILATIIFDLVASTTIDNGVCTTTADYCWSCNSNTTSATTTYNLNLNKLLGSLSSNIDQTNYGFYNSSQGTGTNKVNAIAICRGDLAQIDCISCYNDSSLILLQNCSNQHQAVIWALGCTVRFSNMSIFGIQEDEPTKFVPSPHSIPNFEQFKLVLNPLLKNLSEIAASGDSMKKFAAGHALVPETIQTIYATVQCSPDLEKQKCNDCLEEAIEDISNSTIDGKDGGRILKPSCSFRFENSIFYESAADSGPPATSPTQGNNTSNLTTKVSPSSFFQLLLSLLCFS